MARKDLLVAVLLSIFLLESRATAQVTSPQFTSQPSNSTVAPAATVTLDCSVTGSPTPTITWYKDTLQLTLNSHRQQETSGSLRITNVQNSDVGRYHCVASNTAGSVRSLTATLQLAYINSPSTSTGLQTIPVINLEPVILSCDVPESVPRPQISWIGLSSTQTGGGRVTYSKMTGSLIFSSWNQDSDENIFQCSVLNSVVGSSHSSSHYWTQRSTGTSSLYQPTEFVISPEANLTVVEGETAMFECFTTGRPTATITWTKDGQILSGSRISTEQFGRILTINSVVASDAGNYSCDTSQSASQGPYSISSKGHLTVIVPPRITAGFQQVNASLDQPVLLDCQASGTQPLEWTWRKDGLPLQQREGVAYATSGLQSTLSISMVTENDGGVYQCVVSQPSTGREANSNNFLKPISISPVLTHGDALTDQLVFTGSRVILPCTATGAPTPTYTWTKAGQSQPITIDPNKYILGPGDGNLTIISTVVTDSTTLTCAAMNSAGTVRDSVQLRVIDQPVVTTAPSGQEVITPGESLSQSCAVIHADSDINVVYRWTRDGAFHSNNQNIIITTSSILSENVNVNGLYRCLVRLSARNINEAEPLEWTVGSVVVTVGDPPEPPSAPTSAAAASVLATMFLATWTTPSFNGRLALQNYTIETRRLGSNICPGSNTYEAVLEGISASTTSATVRSLNPYSTYTFRVVAFNSVFRSEPSTESSTFQTQESAPQDTPTSFQVNLGNREGDLIVDWRPIANCVDFGGPITGYVIEYKTSNEASFTAREVGPSSRLLTLSGLLLTTTYQVKVAAKTSSGVGPFTAVMETTTAESTSPPSHPPSQLSHTVINSTTVYLTWEVPDNYSTNDITGFSLVYKTSVGQVIPVDTNIGPEVRSIEVTDLLPGARYTFRLSLLNQHGAGPSRNLTITLPGGGEQLAFYEEVWFYPVVAVGGVLVIAILITVIFICICLCCKCAKSDGKYYITSRHTTSSMSSNGFSEYHNKNRSHNEMIHIHSSPTPSRRSTDYADIGPGSFPQIVSPVYPHPQAQTNGHAGGMYPHNQHMSHDNHMGHSNHNQQGYPHHQGDIDMPQFDSYPRGYSPQSRNIQGQFYPDEQGFTHQDMQYPHQDQSTNTGQVSSRFVDTMTRVHTPPNPHNGYPQNEEGLDYPPSSRNLSQSTDESWNPAENLNYRGHMTNNPVSRSSSFKSTVSTTSFEKGPLPNSSHDARTRGQLSPLPENQFFEQSSPLHHNMNATSLQDIHQVRNRSRSMGQRVNRIENQDMRNRAHSFEGMLDTGMDLAQSNLDIQQRALPPIPTDGMEPGQTNSINSIPNPHSIDYTMDPEVQLSHSQFVSHVPSRKTAQYPSGQHIPEKGSHAYPSHAHNQSRQQQQQPMVLPPPPPFVDGELPLPPTNMQGSQLPPPPLTKVGMQMSNLPPPPSSDLDNHVARHKQQGKYPISHQPPGAAQSMIHLQHHGGQQNQNTSFQADHQRQQSLPSPEHQEMTSSQPWLRKGRNKHIEHVMPQAIPPTVNHSTPNLAFSEQNHTGNTPSGFRRIPMAGPGASHVLSPQEDQISQDSAAAWEQVDYIQQQLEHDMQNMLTPRVTDEGNFHFQHDDFSSPNLNGSFNSSSGSDMMVSPVANMKPSNGYPHQAPPPVKLKPSVLPKVKPKPGSQANGYFHHHTSLGMNKKRPSITDLEHITNNDPKKPMLKKGKVPRSVWVQTSKNKAIESSSESDSDSDLSVDTVIAGPGDNESLKSSHV